MVVVKPDFWRDPNVGAIAALIILVIIFVAIWIRRASN